MDEVTKTPGVGFPEDDVDAVELFRNFSLSQPIKIPADKLNPNYVYRWINHLNRNNLQRKRGMGWSLIKADELEKLCREGVTVDELHIGTHVDASGYVALGDDLIFAKMSKARNNAIKQHQAQINAEKKQSGRRKFHEAGKLVGVSTHEEGF